MQSIVVASAWRDGLGRHSSDGPAFRDDVANLHRRVDRLVRRADAAGMIYCHGGRAGHRSRESNDAARCRPNVGTGRQRQIHASVTALPVLLGYLRPPGHPRWVVEPGGGVDPGQRDRGRAHRRQCEHPERPERKDAQARADPRPARVPAPERRMRSAREPWPKLPPPAGRWRAKGSCLGCRSCQEKSCEAVHASSQTHRDVAGKQPRGKAVDNVVLVEKLSTTSQFN